MKTILILSLMLFNVIFAVEPKDKSEVSIAEEKELIAKIIKWRQDYNLNLGTNSLEREKDLDLSSDSESAYLLNNIDTFGVQKNFDTIVKKQSLENNQYFTEIVAKIQDSSKSDTVQQIFALWDSDKEILEHLKLEYNQVGCSCRLYGNGRICVMHLRYF